MSIEEENRRRARVFITLALFCIGCWFGLCLFLMIHFGPW